jgi:hypothetical protein
MHSARILSIIIKLGECPLTRIKLHPEDWDRYFPFISSLNWPPGKDIRKGGKTYELRYHLIKGRQE